jgi:molybdenum-dependent DNA-binding transcriptional regulator ModE
LVAKQAQRPAGDEMTLDVRVLMTVVQAGSMHKAAERLATSQPAVSRAIADLEHALGVRLLDRSPSGIEPTQYAHAIIKRKLAVFDELKQASKISNFSPIRRRVNCGYFLKRICVLGHLFCQSLTFYCKFEILFGTFHRIFLPLEGWRVAAWRELLAAGRRADIST